MSRVMTQKCRWPVRGSLHTLGGLCNMQQTAAPAGATLNKYERAKVVGMRLDQIARGAPPAVHVEPGMGVRDIVMRELREGKIPFTIERRLPDGGVQRVKVDQDSCAPSTQNKM